MVDFFSEFTLDSEFGGAGEGGFSLNVDGTGSDEPEDDEEVNVEDIEKAPTNADGSIDTSKAVAGEKYFDPQDSPFASGTLSGFSVKGEWTTMKNDDGEEFYVLSMDNLTGIDFSSAYSGTLVLGSGLQISDVSAGANFNFDGGNLTGGFFTGSGSFTLGKAGSDELAYNDFSEGIVTVETKGFSQTIDTGETDDDGNAIMAAAMFEFEQDGEQVDLQTITLGEHTGKATVTVNGDYDFAIGAEDAEVDFKVKNVSAAADITFTYSADGEEVIVDLSALEAEDGKVLNVSAAGGATQLIPPASDEGAIKIGNSTFEYVIGEGSKSAFVLADDAVTGFIFASDDDAITVPAGASALTEFYIDDTDTELTLGITDTASQGYTITRKDDDVYAVEIFDDATITGASDNKTLTFTMSNTLEDGVTVYFDDQGNILSVDDLDNLGDGDTMSYVGGTATKANEGLAIGDDEAIDGYITTTDGKFTFTAGEVATIEVTKGATALATDGYALVSTEAATFKDSAGNTFTYGGGYFTTDENGVVDGFVFTAKGDYVSGDIADLPMTYGTTTVVLPTIEGDDEFTVTLTDATNGYFTISGLDEGTTIEAAPFADALKVGDDDNEFTIDAAGNIVEIANVEVTLTLEAGTHEITINGDVLTYISAGDLTLTITEDDGIDVIAGLTADDVVKVVNADEQSDPVLVFEGMTGTNVEFTANGINYTISGDSDGLISVTGADVEGLDQDAKLYASEGPVTVNSEPYNAEAVATGYAIYGFNKKAGGLGSYQDDPKYPLINANTAFDDVLTDLGIAGIERETKSELADASGSTMDYSSESSRKQVNLNTSGNRTVKFNDAGKNVAFVTEDAEDTKNIILGAKGDAVVMQGEDADGLVNITGGAGSDTVVVQGSMPVVFDMSKGGADRVITSGDANGTITLDKYDETTGAGVVIHDPEVPNIKDLAAAIEGDDPLLKFEDGRIFAVDRGEDADGTDNITEIKVNNKDSKHQTMVRLFGYKDNSDVYSDDAGQLVGFTGKDGGTLDASDIDEEVILIGNKDGKHTAGSSLISGAGDDTIYAGANDTVDAGKGANVVKLTASDTREAATVVVGQGQTTIEGLQTGFDGDILNVDLAAADTDVSFNDGVLLVENTTQKFSASAAVTTEDQFIEQLFVNDGQTIKAAIAVDGGTITVDDDSTAPTYYKAKDGAVDFSDYTGTVTVDMGNDWVQSAVGEENATFDGMTSLKGGSGNTLFKGGKGDDTLLAGTGESSLYGGAGKNSLVGNTSSDKAGSTEFFVLGINNGAQNTISGFEFIEDGGSNTATFDALALGMSDNNDVTDVKANSDGSVVVAVKGNESGATEKVTIEGAAGKEFLVDRGTATETVAQIAASEVTVNHDYVDFYLASEKNATVKVGDVANARVYLESPEMSNGIEYVGDFTVIDARGSNADAELAGNSVSNTIYGGNGYNAMWGGADSANDVMYGGTGSNLFYYEYGNGNDVIQSANDGDYISLGMSIDQIDFDKSNVTSSGAVIQFTDGGSLTLNSTASVTIGLDDGNTYTVNRETQQFEQQNNN